MADVITESNMGFITDNAFYIEKSKLYTDLGEGVRSVEFVRVKNNNLLFVEARETFPNPENPIDANLNRYNSQIEEICEKFVHSLNLFSSAKVGIANERLPDGLSLPTKSSLVFVFVIKNHKSKWCKPIRKKLISILPEYLNKIWNPTVYVINHETVIKRGLAIS